MTRQIEQNFSLSISVSKEQDKIFGNALLLSVSRDLGTYPGPAPQRL
jgi:hypothetical protein